MGNKVLLTSVGLLFAGLSVQFASAEQVSAKSMMHFEQQRMASDFLMLDAPVAKRRGESVSRSSASHLTSSGIAAVAGGSLLVDPDSGMLILTDMDGKSRAELRIGEGASQLVVDRKARTAFITHRSGDRIAVVSYGRDLRAVRDIQTRAEPYGIALSPDRKSLLVTTVADKQLSAYDVASGKELWSLEVGPEARGLAIAPSGDEALVTFLNTSAVARVALGGAGQTVRFVPLDRSVPPPSTGASMFHMPRQQFKSARNNVSSIGGMGTSTQASPAADAGRRFSRAAFTATYIGNDMAIVPHQESIPQLASSGGENTGVYGGGSHFERPIQHRLAFLSTRPGEFEKLAKAEIALHQPRALGYDAARDVLYVAGYGSDSIIALAEASKPSIRLSYKTMLSNAADPCGPTSLTVADDGSVMAFCSLSRKVARVQRDDKNVVKLSTSAALAKSRLSVAARRGRALFRMGDNAQLSVSGVMACESCHPEGRQDGLSWRIDGMALQTPLLAGKTIGTHPFKWDGGDKDIRSSLMHTVTRLGGSGINESQADDIAAFLSETKAPRAPTVVSASAVTRGEKLFASPEVGCISCHSGALRTDGKSYELAQDLGTVDTPALVGLASSAPYYHDGSASTLRTLLLENGTIHGMGKLSHLSEQSIGDLVAYLETL